MTTVSDSLAAPNLSDRDVRQRTLVPPERLTACHAVVVGVGAIGRQVALQLAALGMPRLTLFDHDRVAVENLAPQGYWPADLGGFKVDRTGALCRSIQPALELETYPDRFRRSAVKQLRSAQAQVFFCCVDSISTRRFVWEAIRARGEFFVDGRMSAEVIRVLTSATPGLDQHYAATLFAAEEAFAGACTARSTIYTASIAAGLMVSQFTRWLRGLPVEPDLTLNLLAAELTTGPTTPAAIDP